MLSVIIPTEGVEQPTVATLAGLVPGAAAGSIREVGVGVVLEDAQLWWTQDFGDR